MLQSQMENTLFDDAKHIVQIHTVEVTNLHSFAIIPYITQCLLLRMSNKTGYSIKIQMITADSSRRIDDEKVSAGQCFGSQMAGLCT